MQKTIIPHDGFGTEQTLFISGRVISGRYCNIEQQKTVIGRLWCLFRAFSTAPAPNEPIVITCADKSYQTTTDQHGEFHLTVPAVQTENHITYHLAREPHTVAHNRIVTDTERNEHLIISDIDDTVIKTYARNVWRALWIVVTASAQQRKTYPQAAALYQKLVYGTSGTATNPLFYISSSPWQLRELITASLRWHGFPSGPIQLHTRRRITSYFTQAIHQHKQEKIETILNAHHPLPAILLGDSGQHDAAIYATVAKKYPDRIRAIYIRDVTRGTDEHIVALQQELKSYNVPLILAHSTEGLESDMRQRHFITDLAMESV